MSIVIPVYNEQESLPALLERTTAACKQLSQPYEIILVDDGSSDSSADMLTAAAEKPDSHIIAVLLNRNYGQHSAIMAGFNQVTGDLVITLDADLQNPPEEILVWSAWRKRAMTWWAPCAPTVKTPGSAKRFARDQHDDSTRHRQVDGDYGCMLRAYRRHIVEAMLHCHERSTFIPILANTFARRTTEIDVRHAEREFGDSKYSLMKLINLMYDLITCLTTTPLRLLSVVGSIVALSGFVLALVLIALRLLLGPEWAAGGVFTLFAVLFTFIGAQFVGMGLLGEYIGRIYTDVRARPRYFVQKVVGVQQDHNTQEEE